MLAILNHMRILSIETSCDETAVALAEEKRGKFFVLDEYVSSQAKVHSPFGGVVPNLAAREHVKNLPILLKKIISKNKIGPKNIDLIAVTEGPGLIPALLIGTNAAKALAYAWKKPLVGVNHVVGHIYANFLQGSTFPFPDCSSGNSSRSNLIKFPILALIVSGGHTELILMKKHMDFKIIGQTLDDAAGEAFDKVAKILGLGYPGGPEVAAEATKFQVSAKARLFPSSSTALGIPQSQALPRPMINSKNLDFSFSGLKTAVLYTVRDNPKILKSKKMSAGLCAEFQQAVIDVLTHKTIAAAKKYRPKTILLGGGVSANRELRRQLGNAIKKNGLNAQYILPDTQYSMDNAAMIAIAGYYKWKFSKNPPKARLARLAGAGAKRAKGGKKQFYNNWRNLEADANLRLK